MPLFIRPPLTATALRTRVTSYKQLPRLWFRSQSTLQRKVLEGGASHQKIEVYRIATMKADTHQERGLDRAVKRALKEVRPQVVEYTAQNTITGLIWAQIRCGFHHSRSGARPNSAHATIRLYNGDSKHIGGVHAPENPKEAASFKGGIKEHSYHDYWSVKLAKLRLLNELKDKQ